jgi:hypothetical protein
VRYRAGVQWVGAVAVIVVALAGSGASADASATTAVPLRPPAGGVMIGWHEHGDDVNLLRTNEAQLGTRFALVRMYQQWQVPSRKIGAVIGEGRLPLVSHKPPAPPAGWAVVASGTEDRMIEALADAYRAYGREVLFSFHHEPHDDASDVKAGTYGTSSEYRAAWRRIRDIFVARGAHHSAGGNVFFAYSAVGSWALKAAPGGAPGSGDPLYPGGDIIDVFAHDQYNWASCRNDPWEEFAPGWAPLVRLAAAHHKPLIAAEFGSPPAGGARNDWFRNAATWLRTDPLARRWMWGFAYFHTLHDTCPWDFLNQGDDGRLGWQEAFRDPYFTGTPFSLASDDLRIDGAGSPPIAAPPPTVPQPRPGPAVTTTTTTRRTTPTSGPGSAPPQPAGVTPDPSDAAAAQTPPAASPTPAGAAPALSGATPTPDVATLPGEGQAAVSPVGQRDMGPRSPLSAPAVRSAALLVLGLAVMLRRVTH